MDDGQEEPAGSGTEGDRETGNGGSGSASGTATGTDAGLISKEPSQADPSGPSSGNEDGKAAGTSGEKDKKDAEILVHEFFKQAERAQSKAANPAGEKDEEEIRMALQTADRISKKLYTPQYSKLLSRDVKGKIRKALEQARKI